MRSYFLFFISSFLFPVFIYSQDSSKIKIPADTSAYCIIQLEDGMLLKGRIAGSTGSEINFIENNLGRITIKIKKISFIEVAGNGMYFLFYMKDGSLLHGKIISQNENQIEIETKSIGKQTISLDRIKEMRKINEKDIRRKGKYRYPNMNAYRYFFSPSAIPTNKEEGYYQTVDFLVNNFNYGITKNISIGGGAVLPIGFFIMPKYGYKLNDRMHIGAGMMYGQTLLKFRKTNYKIGALYGMATFGTFNNNITFGIGEGFFNANNETDFLPKPLLMVNGMLRISRRIAFVGENTILPIKNCYYAAAGKVCEYNYKNSTIYGMRFMKEKVTLDAGLLHYPQETFSAFPYLDFVIKF